MNDGPYRDPGTGHFPPRPKETPTQGRSPNRVGYALGCIWLLSVLFTARLWYSTVRQTRVELRAAQAEVERLSGVKSFMEITPDVTCGLGWVSTGAGVSQNTPILCSDGRLDWNGYSYQRIETPKPQPKRAALPPYRDEAIPSRTNWDTPAVAMPFDPEEERLGKVGPILIETPGGSLKWRRVEIPRKQR